jgi:hypothetical protein
MKKITQDQTEQKMKSRSLKEVKSKVLANITYSPGAGISCDVRNRSSSILELPVSSRALKENIPLKAKSGRSRLSLSQQQQ